MLVSLQHRPLLCAAAGFGLGIALWAAGLHSLAAAGAAALLGLALLCFPRPLLVLAGLALAGLGLGALRLALFQVRVPADLSRWADGPAPVLVTGVVSSDPERRAGHVLFVLRAERIEARGQTHPTAGQCVVTLPASSNDQTPDYGDRVVLDGSLETPPRATNPGAFSWRDLLSRQGIDTWLRVPRPQSAQILGPAGSNPILRLAWHVRRRILAGIGACLPPTQAAVLGGILIGQKANLPSDLMDDFVRTGTVHILASAGLHVGIVAAGVFGMLRLLTLPRKSSALLLMLTLALYAVVCGGRPSVTRAVVVAIVYLGALLCERDPDGLTALAAAALVILALQPTALLESGFQLSFLTVLTLAMLMPVWSAFWLPRVERRFALGLGHNVAVVAAELCGVAVIAQLGALPLVAQNSNLVSLLSVPANLLVVPMLFWVLPLGFAGAWIWPLWHGAGAFLFWLCHFGLMGIVWVVRECASPDWGAVAVQSPSPGLVAAYYLTLALAAWALHRWLPSPSALPVRNSPSAAA